MGPGDTIIPTVGKRVLVALVSFEEGTSALNEDGMKTLDTLGRELKSFPLGHRAIVLVGQLRRTECAKNATELSRLRAVAARSYLVHAFAYLDEAKLSTIEDRGCESPLDEEDAARNGLVEIFIAK
jgi:outer membrane protein OmpA-like peptidoglycan-associated protein